MISYSRQFIESERYGDEAISLPIYYNLTKKKVEKVCKSILNFT